MNSAATQPLNTSAMTTATDPATMAPTTGTNAPRNTITPIGIASGTCRMSAPITTPSASVTATTSCTRMKLVRVCQPASPAASMRGRARRGNSRTTQPQMRRPSISTKMVVKTTMNRPSRTCTAPLPASWNPDAIDDAWDCR